MKPDKHKKKRSQQYKKTHDVKNDKAGVSQSKGEKKATRGADDKTTSNNQSTWSTKSKTTPVTLIDSSSSDDEGDQVFHRRVMKSNWERYQELPDQTDRVESRGADFSLLLQGTSSAVSQFRFADELALDTDLESTTHVQPCLTIDPHDIAAAFQCIPLHTKLNVDEKYFEKDMIDVFNKEAENHRQLYEDHKKQYVERQDADKNNAVTLSNKDSLLCADGVVDLDSVLDTKFIGHPSDQGITGDTGVIHIQNDSLITSDVIEDLDEILAASTTTPIDVDKMLDDSCRECLESSPTPNNVEDSSESSISGKETTYLSTKTAASSESNNITRLEDELDQLLSLDNVKLDDVEGTTNSSKTKLFGTTDETETKDLEDWLDSVLDS